MQSSLSYLLLDSLLIVVTVAFQPRDSGCSWVVGRGAHAANRLFRCCLFAISPSGSTTAPVSSLGRMAVGLSSSHLYTDRLRALPSLNRSKIRQDNVFAFYRPKMVPRSGYVHFSVRARVR
jgi:hypothetical protein